MGMYDVLEVEYPLPDGFVPPVGTVWQTKDTPAQYLVHYRLAGDGTLSEMPGETPVAFHGCLAFYATNIVGISRKGVITENDTAPWWAEYQCLYDHGQLLKIEGGQRFEADTELLSRAEFYHRPRTTPPFEGGDRRD